MRDINVTLAGWVASDPTFVITRDGQGPALSTFRMGQTPRYRDRSTGEWKDANTEWFTVRVFKDGAYTVADSIKKGQPVVVEGRMSTSEWIDNDKNPRVTLQIDANVVGHDLTKGIANFTRATVTASIDEDAISDSGDAHAPDDEMPAMGDDVAPLDEREGALA